MADDNKKDDGQSAGTNFVNSLKDAATLKPQRDAVSNAINDTKTKIKNTASNVVDRAKFYMSPNYNFGDKPPEGKKPAYFKNGTDYVKETGPAILHKGEAVLKKEHADKYREAKMAHKSYDVASELGGHKEEKPKKEIHHIKTKKAKSGGYIHTHVHTHPEAHPDEEHVSPDQDAMVDHMLQHMGQPDSSEEEAEAAPGQGAQAAPAPQAAPIQ